MTRSPRGLGFRGCADRAWPGVRRGRERVRPRVADRLRPIGEAWRCLIGSTAALLVARPVQQVLEGAATAAVAIGVTRAKQRCFACGVDNRIGGGWRERIIKAEDERSARPVRHVASRRRCLDSANSQDTRSKIRDDRDRSTQVNLEPRAPCAIFEKASGRKVARPMRLRVNRIVRDGGGMPHTAQGIRRLGTACDGSVGRAAGSPGACRRTNESRAFRLYAPSIAPSPRSPGSFPGEDWRMDWPAPFAGSEVPRLTSLGAFTSVRATIGAATLVPPIRNRVPLRLAAASKPCRTGLSSDAAE